METKNTQNDENWILGLSLFICNTVVCLHTPPSAGLSGIRFSNNQYGLNDPMMGWSGGAKVSCILCHRGVQLILAYSWARSAILVAGKGREVMFLFLLFLYFHSCSSFFPVPLSSLLLSLLSLFLPFSVRRHKMTHKGWRVVKPQHNQWSNELKILLQSQQSFKAESWYTALKTQSLPRLYSWWP